MEQCKLRFQPGIGIMLYLAAVVGLRAKMLNRACIANVRRRPIPNQALAIVAKALSLIGSAPS